MNSELKGSQTTWAAHAATTQVLRTHQTCVPKVEVCPQTHTSTFEELRHKGFRSGTHDGRPHHGKFVKARIANGPSQLKQNNKQRVSVERTPPQELPGNDVLTSDEKKGNDRTSPLKFLSDEEYIPSNEQGRNDQFLALILLPDEMYIKPHDVTGEERIPLQEMPGDDIISSENQEGAERILPNCKTRFSEICLFEEAEEILLFNKKNSKVSNSVRRKANMIRPLNCVFYFDAGPILIR